MHWSEKFLLYLLGITITKGRKIVIKACNLFAWFDNLPLNNMIWFFQVGFLVRSKVKKKTLLFDVTTTISLGQLLKQEDQCSAAAFATTSTKKRLPFMIGHKSTLFLDRNRPFFGLLHISRVLFLNSFELYLTTGFPQKD